MSTRFPLLIPAAAVLLVPSFAPGQKPLRERDGPLVVVEPDANERDLRMTPVVKAVQRTADSVVSIYLGHGLANGGVAEGQGSGVILDESGLVITNWHVIAPVVVDPDRGGRIDVAVKLRDGRTRSAQVLSSSPTRDLALLQMRLEGSEKVKPAEIGRSGDLMIGETLIAIGNPQGHANTVTTGVLSATGRTINVRTPDGVARKYTDLLQTDAAINQGNSGGALLDITGKLIGINNAMAVGAENIGFAIPMDVVRTVFEQELTQFSSLAVTDAPWLGIEVKEQDGAVVVAEVVGNSPADAVGVQVGDVLTHVAEQPVRNSLEWLRRVVTARPAEPLALQLRRNDRELRVAPVPTSRVDARILMAVGARLEEVALEQEPALVRRATLAYYRDSGLRRVNLLPAIVRVVSVQNGSPAESVGLQTGDVLLAAQLPTRFGDRELPLTSTREAAKLFDSMQGRSLRIAVLRDDEVLDGTIDVRTPRKR